MNKARGWYLQHGWGEEIGGRLTTRKEMTEWLQDLTGQLSPDPYSTAWAALVPKLGDLNVPAWPEALIIFQKPVGCGGWGEPSILYVHEHTLGTVAAIHALHTWQMCAEDPKAYTRA